MFKLISVITPTCSRTDILLRAVRTVKAQTYPRIEHLIIGDNHPTLESLQAEIKKINPQAVVANLNTPKEIFYPSQRASIARNEGVRRARGELVSFLDDDNVLESNHLSSLAETQARERVEATYSWRKLVDQNGNPSIVNEYPWAIDPFLAGYVFKRMVEAGIFIPGTNEVRDQMVAPDGDPILHIDTSEWLMTRTLALKHPFSTSYTLRQIIQHHTEDYILAGELYRCGVKTACSEKATLIYYLGGYSNGNSQ